MAHHQAARVGEKGMKRVLFCVTALMFGNAAAGEADSKGLAAQPLGRLFYTPAERAQLDIARMQKKPSADATAAAAPPPEPPPMPQTVTYGGIVRRSDGKAMLWINNRLVEEKEALTGLNVKGKVRPDGAVTLQVPQTGGSINVKVGQSVELQTGKIGEARKPEPKPPPEEVASPAVPAKPPTTAGPPPPAEGQAAPTTAMPPESPAGERKPEPSGSVGLKLDRGGRALQPAEEQRLRNRSEGR